MFHCLGTMKAGRFLTMVECCFTSTETVGLLGTSTSTFTQLLSSVILRSVEVLLYVHRNRRLIRDGSPGQPPRLSHRS